MSRLAASFVLGYHGCEARVARKIINCEEPLRASDKKYDWLGPGTYFWESDPFRAMEWAQQAKTRGRIETPAVVGAVIDLGNCLDLLNRENIELVRDAHRLFVQEQKRSGLPIPANRSLEGEPERILRFLDRAVIQFLHEIFEVAGEAASTACAGCSPKVTSFTPAPGSDGAIISRSRYATRS